MRGRRQQKEEEERGRKRGKKCRDMSSDRVGGVQSG